jgi:hypothetical protein
VTEHPRRADQADEALEPDERTEFDWQWIQQAPNRELSAHGRQVQARPPWQQPDRPARPSWAKRVRFRLYLLVGRGQRRRS